MNAIELAQKVVAEKQAHLFRMRKGTVDQYDAVQYDHAKRGWAILDGYSASAILVVFNALNEANREKFAALPLTKMAMVAFKLMK